MIIGWRSELVDGVKEEGNLTVVEGTSPGGWWVEQHITPMPAQVMIYGSAPIAETTIQPTAATITITGGTPTVRNNVTVWPTAAQVEISGGVPSLGELLQLQPTAATVTITGHSPQLKQTITPTAATVQIAGGIPPVSFEQLKLQPTAASVTVSGGTPPLVTTILPTAATVSVAGGTPPLEQTIRPTAASVSVAGGTPLVIYQPVNVQPTAASVTITGGQPPLITTVRPTAATVSIAGGTPVVHNNVTVTPTAATVSVTGGQPPLMTTVRPTAATVSVSGGVPTVSATSPLAIVGSNSMANYINSTGNTVSIPAHQIGDLILIIAYKSTNNVGVPAAGGTVPSWSSIENITGTAPGWYIGSYVATATNETSGAWLADTLAVVVFRYQKSTSPIGSYANQLTTTGTTANAPAVTPVNTDGTSIILAIFGSAGVTNSSWDAPPAGWTRVTAINYASNQPGICVNVKTTPTSAPASTQTTIYTSGLGPYYARGETLEILKH